jgi:hypothetical protein
MLIVFSTSPKSHDQKKAVNPDTDLDIQVKKLAARSEAIIVNVVVLFFRCGGWNGEYFTYNCCQPWKFSSMAVDSGLVAYKTIFVCIRNIINEAKVYMVFHFAERW